MQVRVYYEDTDAAGIVYHANYLNFMERARTEYFRDRNLLVTELASNSLVFPVIRIEMNLLSPARHDDLLTVDTKPERLTGSTILLHQQITRVVDGRLLADARITLACTGSAHKAKRIPIQVRQVLQAELPSQCLGQNDSRQDCEGNNGTDGF